MDKQVGEYSFSEIVFNDKNEWTANKCTSGDEFKIMMLSKRGEAKKNTSFLCTFILVYEILEKASLIHSDIRQIMVARGCGVVIRKGYQRASWSNGKLPDVDRGGGHRIAWICHLSGSHKSKWILTWVHFVVCKLYSKIDFYVMLKYLLNIH